MTTKTDHSSSRVMFNIQPGNINDILDLHIMHFTESVAKEAVWF